MNPRDFCRKPGFPVAILLTFNFDPFFFERVILRDLELGETEDILVIADQNEIAASVSRWRDQVAQLGQKYQLIPAKIKNTFHPKMILRFGPTETGVWIGSGNLSFGGWGGNQEIATSWFSAEDENNSVMLSQLLEDIKMFIPGSLLHDAISRAEKYVLGPPNINSPEPIQNPILFSVGHSSLSSMIHKRWATKSFRKVTILTGSTDENGALLHWFYENFGVQEAIVVIDQDRVNFSPKKLETLPLKISVKSMLSSKPLHAKFYWFEGDQGCAAIVGSANCSAAAWLAAPDRGGNIEAIAVYEDAEGENFRHILDILNDVELVETILKERPIVKVQTDSSPLVGIPEIFWESSSGLVTVIFPWSNFPINHLQAQFSDELIGFAGEDLVWKSEGNIILSETRTKFIEFAVEFQNGAETKIMGWINDLTSLQQSSKVRKITSILHNFGSAQPNPDHRKMLEDLQNVSQVLLEGSEHFPDSISVGNKETKNPENMEESHTINPENFIKSITELNITDHQGSVTHRYSEGISVSAVLSAFFGNIPNHEEILDDDEDLDEGVGNVQVAEPRNNAPIPFEAPAEKFKQKFQTTISKFLDRLTEQRFINSCSVTQLKNAIAYPLCTCYFGQKHGWLEQEIASDFIKRTLDIVFMRLFPGISGKGLLSAVRKRYEESNKSEIFQKEIGDGELWAAFLVSIGEMNWIGLNGPFHRSLAMRFVFQSKDLIESANLGRFSKLVFQLDEIKRKILMKDAHKAVINFNLLENELSSRSEELNIVQQNYYTKFEKDDVIWISGGWAEVVESVEFGEKTCVYHHAKGGKITVSTKLFLNVSKLSQFDARLNELFSKVCKN